MLDAEQVAMIYEYVTIKADVQNIFAQIRFCQEFSTKFIRNMKQGFCLVTLEMALNQLVGYPELIGAGAEDEENDERWQERTRSIGSSMRQQSSNFAQLSNNRQVGNQFALAVPENILAPLVQLEPSRATLEAQNKRGVSQEIKFKEKNQLHSGTLQNRSSLSIFQSKKEDVTTRRSVLNQ